ncbi:hypothetical protein I316_02219 [Kwoniella heveanensis BCC8398]|uniref:Major facilitator superfamily (MFS) profile domain-containing protein n=1 Tax=Kwoniella heveanensis BCC8398 TaxID=1296120 RepID=A0A1B9GZC2_9TREE|nr:hypothetical protein I316_02219 [Kwoniella heveanensis BCC8398]
MSSSIATSSRIRLDDHTYHSPCPNVASSSISPALTTEYTPLLNSTSPPQPHRRGRFGNMVSTMLGFTPKGHDKAEPEDLAVIDPSAHIDPQTGAIIEKKSKRERLFVARLDAILLVYCCISQVIKYLDQQKLNLYGNEYNYFTTYFNIGYAIFLIPSQIIITRVRPSIYLPLLEIGWGVLTIATYKVHNAKQVYALRAFTGAMEASCYPGAIMLLMSWYTPREMALRIGFYHSCQSVGNMLAGALQAAIYNSLDGKNGISGWRYMFIIDGIITVVAACAGFFLIPDFPSKPNPLAFWLRPRHVEIALERSAKFKRADNKKFTLSSVKKAITGPVFYLFVIMYVASVLAQASYQYFNLWLKSLKHPDGTAVWSVAQVNLIPLIGGAITIATIWVWGFISDYYQTRWIPVLVQASIGIIPGIIMSIWHVSNAAKYFSYFVCYLSLATAPPIWAWLSDVNPFDAEQRAFTLGFAIAFYYACGAWSGPLIWPAKTAPHYKYGWGVQIALWCLVIILACSLRYFEVKYIRPKNRKIAEEREAAARAAEQAQQIEAEEDLDKKDHTVQRVTSV